MSNPVGGFYPSQYISIDSAYCLVCGYVFIKEDGHICKKCWICETHHDDTYCQLAQDKEKAEEACKSRLEIVSKGITNVMVERMLRKSKRKGN